MKQKDIAVIVVAAFISFFVAIFLSKIIIAPPKNRQQQVEVVDKISPTFNKPDSKYFNPNAINPTRTITIQQQNNSGPFNNSTGQ